MPVWMRRFWIQLTSDRKKFAALCIAICLGMLLWARLIVVSRMPRTAIADESAVAANKTPQSSNKQSQALSEDQGPITIALSETTTRDPFSIDPRFFPRPTGPTGLTQDAGKSQSKAVEELSQSEARLAAQWRDAVERLRLDAAVAGSIAVINGKTCRTGEWIAASGDRAGSETVRFQIIEIRHRSVILQVMEQQFEIQMPTPRGTGG